MDHGEGALAKHLDRAGIADALREEGIIENSPKTDAEALAAWISHHGISLRHSNGKPFTGNPHRLLAILSGLASKTAARKAFSDEEEKEAA